MAKAEPLEPAILCSSMELACRKCGHEYIIDLAGISPSTQVVCPSCEFAFRMSGPELDRTLGQFEKGLGDIQQGGFSAEVVSAAEEAGRRIAAGKANPENVATTYPIERGTRHPAHRPARQAIH